MNRDKQIEEMSGDIEVVFNYGYVDFNKTAEKLIAKGYRKASEVAREIIGQVEILVNNYINAIDMLEPKNVFCGGGKTALEIVLKSLTELKKKYESEGEG